MLIPQIQSRENAVVPLSGQKGISGTVPGLQTPLEQNNCLIPQIFSPH